MHNIYHPLLVKLLTFPRRCSLVAGDCRISRLTDTKAKLTTVLHTRLFRVCFPVVVSKVVPVRWAIETFGFSSSFWCGILNLGLHRRSEMSLQRIDWISWRICITWSRHHLGVRASFQTYFHCKVQCNTCRFGGIIL